MIRSSSDRAAIRLSLAVSIALSLLIAGFSGLKAHSGPQLTSPAAANSVQPLAPVQPGMVISQVFGGGGNGGAPYNNDFIELFNRGTSPVNLNGWSVQYSSATGSSWAVTNLTNVTVQPGQYYLVQEAAGAGTPGPLPTPDATGSINMSGTAGKVALVSSTTALSGCTSDATIVDKVGYGATANCFEGSAGPAPAPSNSTAVLRANGGCTDTDGNSVDFATGTPTPRNTSTAVNVCPAGTPTPTPSPPTATTNAATNVSDINATLNGSVNPNFASTTVHFQYGPDTNYGSLTPDVIFTGSTDQNVSVSVGSLSSATMYHYRIVAMNSAGTTMGNDAMFTTTQAPNPFAACDLIIYRVGDGNAALTTNAAPVFLDEYTTAGALVQSIAMPTAISGSNKRLTASGIGTSEGLLTVSSDGQYLVTTGYDADVGTLAPNGNSSTAINRVVARVTATGIRDTTTALTDAASGNSVRSATSTNGTDLWVTGGAGGIRYTTLGATTSLQLDTTSTNVRATNIFGGQLYVSSASGALRLGSVGTGTPTTAPQTIANLPGIDSANLIGPYAFYFADLDASAPGNDTLYVADDGAGVINKFSLVSGTWTSNGTIALIGLRGLTGKVDGTVVTLYATAAGNTTTAATLSTFVDSSGYNGSIAGMTATTIATAPTNTGFRGVAFTPLQCGTPAPIHFEVSAPANATAGTAFNFTVTARDQSNQTVTDYAGTVHFTSSDGQAVLPANSTLSSGAGTFSATLKTAGNQTITATDTASGSIHGTSGTIAVGGTTATHLTVTAPSTANAGTPFSIAVTARDQFNNTATGYTGTVHFTKSDSGAGSAVPADYTFVAGDNGVHTFNNGMTFATPGNQTVSATDTVTGSITGTSNNVAVSTGGATHFTVSAPASATAGTAFNFTVTALDQFNNTSTSYSGTVHFTSSDGQAVLPANATLTSGTGTFSATLKTAGNQTITATDTVTSSITGTSSNVAVSATTATHFTVTAPASASAGTAFNFTVTAKDQFNNTATGYGGIVHFTSSDGQAALPANSTLTNGTATLSATLKTLGNQTITATDTVTSSITGTSGSIAVSAGAATHFSVSAPASANKGAAFNFTVTAQDQFNNTAAGYTGTVHFTSSDGSATLPANSTLTNGTGTFSATLQTTGNQTITATDTLNGSITGTSNTINVNGATHFTVTAPANATAGTAFNFTVTAVNDLNQTVTDYAGTVHFTSNDGQAVLPANSTLSSGVGTFSATLKTTGNRTITATDTVSSINGTSGSIAVSAATATHLVVTAPANATAGTPFSITVTAQDQFNNTATGYTGTVHFTKTDNGAGSSVPGNYQFVAGDNGVHTFTNGVTFVTAGNQTVTATDTATGSINGTSGNVLVSAANATHFTVSAPATATAGIAFNFTVTAQDQFNNTATGYTGTVHFTATIGQSVLPANSTLTNGTGTFSATLKTAGTKSITATDTVTSSITGRSNNIAVSAAGVAKFAVSTPASATAGVAFNFAVAAQDAFNNTVTGYTGTVHFSSTDGQAALPVNSTLTNGAGTFSAILKTAGNQTITATDTVTSSITGTSNSTSVSAAGATHLTVSAPTNATAGIAFNVTVTALDQFNNTATGYAGTLHFTSTDAQAVLPADSGLANGTGTFSATLKTAGNQTITATDTVTPSLTGTSSTITVAAGTATHFAVVAPPGVAISIAFNFTVTAQDAFNNTDTSYAGTVFFTSTDGHAVLPANGPLTNGVGTFSATLKTAGIQTITATDTLTPSITGTSNPILVTLSGVIIDPVPGSTLSSPIVTFHWVAPAGTTAYWLTIGDDKSNTAPCGDPSKAGGANIFSSGQTGGTSWTVTNLPVDGRTLYVRLWSLVSGTWSTPPQDYTYIAGTGGPNGPLISPNSGTFTKKAKVTMGDSTPCVTIRYEMSTTATPPPDPTISSTPYTGVLNLTGKGTKILKAKAFRSTDNTQSQTVTATLKIK